MNKLKIKNNNKNMNLEVSKLARWQVAQLDGSFFFPRLMIGALLVSLLGSPMAILANIYLLAVIPAFGIFTLIVRFNLSKRTKVIIRSPHYYTSSLSNFIGNAADVFAAVVSAVISIYQGFDATLINIFPVLVLVLCFYRIPFYTLMMLNKPLLAFEWINCYHNFIKSVNVLNK